MPINYQLPLLLFDIIKKTCELLRSPSRLELNDQAFRERLDWLICRIAAQKDRKDEACPKCSNYYTQPHTRSHSPQLETRDVVFHLILQVSGRGLKTTA